MKLSVATNFDDKLIDAIKDFPVYELYGKLDKDFVGGGRSSYILSRISRKRIKSHIAYAKKYNIGFNYLLNAACMDNLETTKEGQRQIRGLLDWMTAIGVSSTTVSNPFLLKTIKKSYPHFKVRVSVFACVDNLAKARYWQDSGADVICLDSHSINREFEELRFLKENLTCECEILVNNNCLKSCYMAHTHPNLMSHSSQSKHKSGGFVIDHCMLFCLKQKISDPVNFLRSDWIRPEDIKHYEDIGFERFKIVERNLPTEHMVKRVAAYSNRSYDGNLLDLVQGFGFKDDNRYNTKGLIQGVKFLFKPLKINVFKLGAIKKLCETRGLLAPLKKDNPIYIDNKKLDGFIDRFLSKGCRHIKCEDCNYCHKFLNKAVYIDPQYKEECLILHKKVDDQMFSGKLW